MRHARSARCPPLAQFSCEIISWLCTSETAAVESDAGEVVEVPIVEDTTGKEIALCDFDPQSYTLDEARLTVFQIDEVRNLLRAVFGLMKIS